MSENIIGFLTEGTPFKSIFMPRCRICGSLNTSSSVFIGPAGTPKFSHSINKSAEEKLIVFLSIRYNSSSRFSNRAGFVLNLSFLYHSASNILLKFLNCSSLPTAKIIYPSRVETAQYGTIFG